ncbi:MAG: hypothetical protein M8467_01780 [Anaerolineae bacterium]|nr:hypothetical protein [Anaerolineae bacterium]
MGAKQMDDLYCRIRRWRLTLPALLFLEIARPFSFLASQGLLLCQPLLSYLVDESSIAGYAELLADRENLDRLVARLEEREPVRDPEGEEKG